MPAHVRRRNKLERFSVAKRYLVLISRICVVLVGAIVLFVFANVCAYVYLRPALPDVDSLREVQLQVPLRVYTRDGRLIAAIGEQRRIPVRYDQLPPKLIQAFLATEDDRFFQPSRRRLARDFAGGARQCAGRRHPPGREHHHHAGGARHVPDAAARHEAQNERDLHLAADGGRIHQGGNLLPVREQDLPRPARLRRGGRGRGVLRQEPGPAEHRGNGDARRHSDRPLHGQSGRQSRGREDSPRPCARPDARARLHHPGGVRAGQVEPDGDRGCTARLSRSMPRMWRKWCATTCRPSTATASIPPATRCSPPSIRACEAAATVALRTGLLEYDRRHGWRGATAKVDLSKIERRPQSRRRARGVPRGRRLEARHRRESRGKERQDLREGSGRGDAALGEDVLGAARTAG